MQNRQFCDVGEQYRTAIFVHGAEQRKAALASKAALEQSKPFPQPVVTPVVDAGPFYPAEEYHQDYESKNYLRYCTYRAGCGRDARLRELWGAAARTELSSVAFGDEGDGGRVRKMLALALASSAAVTVAAAAAKEWRAEDARAILDKTLVLRLAPALDHLEPGERQALDALLVGRAAAAADVRAPAARAGGRRAAARSRRAAPTCRTSSGCSRGRSRRRSRTSASRSCPSARTRRARTFYPLGATREARSRPSSATTPARAPSILDPRSVVRGAADLEGDLLALDRRPDLEALHPGLRERMRGPLYAIPYALPYAAEQDEAGRHLLEAAAAVRGRGSRLRRTTCATGARDFLSNDYESGDASWVIGLASGNLNAQIGSYETYDDELFGVKTFDEPVSVLVRDEERTRALRAALRGIQAIEDALPYPPPHRKVRENLPVGVYNVVADFGQARGTNTATILPNESRLTRKYGRTILLRYNVMTHPDLFAISQRDVDGRDGARARAGPGRGGRVLPDALARDRALPGRRPRPPGPRPRPGAAGERRPRSRR